MGNKTKTENEHSMNKKWLCSIATGIAASAFATTNEVADLRTQLETVTKRLDDLEKAGGTAPAAEKKANWTEKIKVDGYVRIRYDHDTVDGNTTENRMRFRAMAGVYGNATEELYGGVRVASGSDSRATSENQNFTAYASEKEAWIDLAYLGYAPQCINGLDLSIGKIQKPWIDVDSMYWDGDVNPEGGAIVYNRDLGPVSLFAHGGYFIMNEEGNDDVSMTTAQLAGKTDLAENIALRVGGTAFVWANIDGAAAPGGRTNGNADDGAGNYATGFQVGHLFSDLKIKVKPVEFKLYAEASKNFDSVDDQDQAWLAGFGAKYGKWSGKYNYRDMDENSTVAFFCDSDFAASNISSGHKLSAQYDFTKNFYLGFTYNLADRWDGFDQDTFYFDGVLKF